MSYRGFTWNLTYTEYANIARILEQHNKCAECREWDKVILRTFLRRIETIMEVTPDGTSHTHGPADA